MELKILFTIIWSIVSISAFCYYYYSILKWDTKPLILVDLLAIIPTYRKSYLKPYEETIVIYIMSASVYMFAFIGLQDYSFTTYGYIISIVIADLLLVAFLLIRRKQLTERNKI